MLTYFTFLRDAQTKSYVVCYVGLDLFQAETSFIESLNDFLDIKPSDPTEEVLLLETNLPDTADLKELELQMQESPLPMKWVSMLEGYLYLATTSKPDSRLIYKVNGLTFMQEILPAYCEELGLNPQVEADLIAGRKRFSISDTAAQIVIRDFVIKNYL